MPVRLHVFFQVPALFALQMAADQAYRSLHNGHGIAIRIGGDLLEIPAGECRAIVKIHAHRLASPFHRGGGAVGRTDIGLGALDVLHTAGVFQKIEVIRIRPLSPHANAQVLAT